MSTAPRFVGHAFLEGGESTMWRCCLIYGRIKIDLGRHECRELAEAEIRLAIRDLKRAAEAFEADEVIRSEPPAKPKSEPPVWTDEDCRDEVLQSVTRLIDCPLDGRQRQFIEQMQAKVQTDDFRISVRQLDWLRQLFVEKVNYENEKPAAPARATGLKPIHSKKGKAG